MGRGIQGKIDEKVTGRERKGEAGKNGRRIRKEELSGENE